MTQVHFLILCAMLLVALGVTWVAVHAAQRASAAARRAVEVAEAASIAVARQQVMRDENLKSLQDHVARGIQILARGCESTNDGHNAGNQYRTSGDVCGNPGDLH